MGFQRQNDNWLFLTLGAPSVIYVLRERCYSTSIVAACSQLLFGGACGTTHQDEAAQNVQGARDEAKAAHVPLDPATAPLQRRPCRDNCGSLHKTAGHDQR